MGIGLPLTFCYTFPFHHGVCVGILPYSPVYSYSWTLKLSTLMVLMIVGGLGMVSHVILYSYDRLLR